MAYALLQNKDGNFVAPDDTTFRAAAANAQWDKAPGFYLLLTDQPGKESWPITGATFILMHKKQDKPENAAIALKFFDWAYEAGDKLALDLDYVPMPIAGPLNSGPKMGSGPRVLISTGCTCSANNGANTKRPHMP